MNSAKKSWVFVVLILASFVSLAQHDIMFRAGVDDGHTLQPYMSVYEDAEGAFKDQSPEDIWNRQGFTPISEFNIETKPFVDYWIKIQIKNADQSEHGATDWVMAFDLGITELDAYVNSNNNIEHHRTGYFLPIRDRTFVPRVKANIIKINIERDQVADVLIRMYSERASIAPVFQASLVDAESYAEETKSKTQVNMLYLGFIMMMLVYNLFMFSFGHDRANIYYSLYLFFVAVFATYNTGDLAGWFQDILVPNRPEYMFYFKLSVYCALMSYLLFIRYFLRLHELLPKWDKVLKWLTRCAVIFLVLDVLLMMTSNFSPDVQDFATIAYSFIFLFVTTYFLLVLYRSTDKKKLYVFWGVLAMNAGIFLTILMRFQSYDFSIFPFRIGSIIEIIFFSIGLVYRQKEQELNEREIEFKLEKSRLLQEQDQVKAERLEELNKFKSNVFANITHEFRTPLTVILGMADRIDNYPKEQHLIKRNSNDLLQLINRLLDLSKAESNQLVLQPIYDDILKYINYLFESMVSAAHSKNIMLKLKSNKEEIYMHFDEAAIKHIVDNLLANAIKFTPKSGHVEIQILETSTESPSLQIIVGDDGIGISEDEQEHIFDRFYQALSREKQEVQGSGIGLALVKEFVELLKGSIEVSSRLNHGTTFTVTLPINRANIPSEPKDTIKKNSGFNSETAISDNGGPLVLLVEDNEDVLSYIESCFDDSYQVLKAKNGNEGLELAQTFIPDIVVSDLMMPQMDGVELCNSLKRDKLTNHIPVILLTARTDRNTRLDALRHGVEAYITKPFDKEELLIRVDQLMKLRMQLQVKYKEGMPPRSNQSDPFLEDLNAYILARIDDAELSLQDIQNWSAMSKTQLYRKVKALTNLSATQYLTQIRLEEAKRILKANSAPISQIAYMVGFADPNYFSRRFSQIFGMSPGEYRDTL